MSDVVMMVLTGGPCAGKTSAMDYLCRTLPQYGVEVFPVQEQASAMMNSGMTPASLGTFAFHRLLFRNQLQEEENALQKARTSLAKKALVLCDRGLLDSRAYVAHEDFDRYAGECGFSEGSIRNRYDAVLHMVTAADGAEDFYTLHNNAARSETPEQARALDRQVLSLWVGTQHLRVLDNRRDFDYKLSRLLRETLAVLGVPEPLEIERKLLIAYPDTALLAQMDTCRKIMIEQAYLQTPEEDKFRVRKRADGNEVLYIKTVKHKISDIKRVEIETLISEKEYYDYLSHREYVQGVIAKDRYCFVWDAQYFELDVYPFWADKATLEIELLSEDEEYRLPDFVSLLRDVSFEKAFRNKHLAVVYGKMFQKE